LPALQGYGDAPAIFPKSIDPTIEYAFVFDAQEKRYLLTPFTDYQTLIVLDAESRGITTPSPLISPATLF